jgi:hypothetical protein
MAKKNSTPKSQPITKQKWTVTFREKGDPEGRTLQEFCEQAPIGTKLKVGGKPVSVKAESGWQRVKEQERKRLISHVNFCSKQEGTNHRLCLGIMKHIKKPDSVSKYWLGSVPITFSNYLGLLYL